MNDFIGFLIVGIIYLIYVSSMDKEQPDDRSKIKEDEDD